MLSSFVEELVSAGFMPATTSLLKTIEAYRDDIAAGQFPHLTMSFDYFERGGEEQPYLSTIKIGDCELSFNSTMGENFSVSVKIPRHYDEKTFHPVLSTEGYSFYFKAKDKIKYQHSPEDYAKLKRTLLAYYNDCRRFVRADYSKHRKLCRILSNFFNGEVGSVKIDGIPFNVDRERLIGLNKSFSKETKDKILEILKLFDECVVFGNEKGLGLESRYESLGMNFFLELKVLPDSDDSIELVVKQNTHFPRNPTPLLKRRMFNQRYCNVKVKDVSIEHLKALLRSMNMLVETPKDSKVVEKAFERVFGRQMLTDKIWYEDE